LDQNIAKYPAAVLAPTQPQNISNVRQYQETFGITQKNESGRQCLPPTTEFSEETANKNTTYLHVTRASFFVICT